MTIATFTCVHGRHDILSKAVESMRSACNYWNRNCISTLNFFAPTTQEDFEFTLLLTRGLPAVVVQAPEPLSTKHNFIVDIALAYDWDYLLTWDSDNMITEEGAIAYHARVFASTRMLQGVRDIFFINSATKEAMSFSYDRFTCANHLMGTGRMFHRNLVQASHPMWPIGLKNGLDIHSELRLEAMGYKSEVIASRLPLWIDVKGPQSVNGYNKWRKGGKKADYDEVLSLAM